MTTDTAEQQLTVREVAKLLGWKEQTVRKYRTESRRDFPEADGMKGVSPWWRPETITTWRDNRPGRGAGGGRPRIHPIEEITPATVRAALDSGRLRTTFSRKLAEAYLAQADELDSANRGLRAIAQTLQQR